MVTGTDVGGSDDHLVHSAVSALRASADVQVCPVSMPGDLDGVLHLRGGRKLVVLGGDASLHRVISALHRRNELDDVVLGILPLGPSNDFARSAGIPMDLEEAVQVVLAGVERRFDLILDCRGDVIVNNVHVGTRPGGLLPDDWRDRLDHLISGERDSDEPLVGQVGHTVGYFADQAIHGVLQTETKNGRNRLPAKRSRPLRVRIDADDEVVADFDQPVLWVDVSNSASTGGGRPPRATGADPSDGYVDVVVRFAVGRLDRVRRTLRSRRHHVGRVGRTPQAELNDRPDTVRVRAHRVRVAGQRFWLNADGEAAGYEQRCTWTVSPQRLRMIAPDPDPDPDA